MLITVIGPNLRDQSKGSFHVHAADCSDIKRRYGYVEDHEMHTDEYTSVEQIVTDVYIDIMNENDESWEAYAFDFHFCPCCSELV